MQCDDPDSHHGDNCHLEPALTHDSATTISSGTDPKKLANIAIDQQGSVFLRISALCLATILIVLLVVASQLQPSPAGLGTHQQLGLPPCTLRVLYSIRCPACGMTTSWSHFTQGQWIASASVNLGGFLLAIYSLFAVFFLLQATWSGRWPSLVIQSAGTISLIGIGVVSLVDWGIRLAM